MTMTSKFVATALLAALVATGCGQSEANCWAKRRDIVAEMQVWASMDDATVTARLGNQYTAGFLRAQQLHYLEASKPDC